MTDELDPTERRIARQLGDFAETPFPASGAPDDVVARAVAEGSASARRRRLGAVLASAAVLLLAIGAVIRLDLPVLSGGPKSTATAATPTDAPTAGAAGRLHLEKDPEYDDNAALELRYVRADGTRLAESDSIDADTALSLDRSLPVGLIRVVANGEECTGTITIEADLEVDAVLRILDDPCSVSVTASHALGAVVHPEPFTGIGAFVVIDSVLVVRPLDAGAGIEPIRRPADARAEVEAFAVTPGRYELALEVAGVVLKTLEIDLKRGQAFYYDMRVLDPDVPLDCGEVPVTDCRAAAEAAYAQPQGAGVPANLHVTSVRVRPSQYTGGCQPFDPPRFDVTFQVLEEPGSTAVTLGGRPNGGLVFCTY